MILIPYDSELWDQYPGAYGNICEEVKIVMRDVMDIPSQAKLRRLDLEDKEDYEIAYDNFWENLWNQMDFYEAMYIVMPYIAKLLENNEDHFDRAFSIILNTGMCLATDIPYFTTRINKSLLGSFDSVYKSYGDAVFCIQEKTKAFIRKYLNEIRMKDSGEKWEFALSVLAILCDREAAYQIYMHMAEWAEGSIPVKCDMCGYYEDCNYLDDDNFIKDITPAPVVQWDGVHYDDMYEWFGCFLHDLGVEEADTAAYLCGTYACPQCGVQKTVIDFMKAELSRHL